MLLEEVEDHLLTGLKGRSVEVQNVVREQGRVDDGVDLVDVERVVVSKFEFQVFEETFGCQIR